jgi:hypothetical protein
MNYSNKIPPPPFQQAQYTAAHLTLNPGPIKASQAHIASHTLFLTTRPHRVLPNLGYLTRVVKGQGLIRGKAVA